MEILRINCICNWHSSKTLSLANLTLIQFQPGNSRKSLISALFFTLTIVQLARSLMPLNHTLILIGLLLSLFLPVAHAAEVRTLGPQSAHDASHDYFTQLLRLALQEAGDNRTISTIEHPGQGRAVELLKNSELYDILWTGESLDRDSSLLKIQIPLFSGGLGIRGSVIKRSFLPTFSNVKQLADLSEYIACQGRHWPDADKLEQAGLHVFRVGHFDAMLKMIDLNRCDYLPLSIFEGDGELKKVEHLYPDLVFTTKVLFQYGLNMYYYVKADNTALAQTVFEGLSKLKLNGKFTSFMQTHPLTKSAFPLSKYQESTIFKLDNSTASLL